MIAGLAVGMVGLYVYLLHRNPRMKENLAYSRRVRGPWRGSESHRKWAMCRLKHLMKRAKRRDREKYLVFKKMLEGLEPQTMRGVLHKHYVEEAKKDGFEDPWSWLTGSLQRAKGQGRT